MPFKTFLKIHSFYFMHKDVLPSYMACSAQWQHYLQIETYAPKRGLKRGKQEVTVSGKNGSLGDSWGSLPRV